MVVKTTAGDVAGGLLVNCTGLQCDRVARLGGVKPEAKIVPFRGEYFELKPEAQSLCCNLIYPPPDPKFPFLGVHFTRMIQGGVECGPNAVLAFAREGYRKRDINVRDLCESLTYIGFLRMAARHWRTGMGEMWRSFSKRAFVKALSRLLPEIRCEHLEPAPAGSLNIASMLPNARSNASQRPSTCCCTRICASIKWLRCRVTPAISAPTPISPGTADTAFSKRTCRRE